MCSRLVFLGLCLLQLPMGLLGFSDEVKENLSKSTVLLLDASGAPLGTAFVISSDGFLVTNYHVVEGKGGHFHAVLWTGERHCCESSGSDPASDLALLRFGQPVELSHALPIEPVSLSKGERVATCGFPDTGGKFFRYGKVQSLDGKFEGLTPGLDYVVMRLRLAKGMSGSPVINEEGVVVGIHNSKEGCCRSLAIPVERLRDLVERERRGFSARSLVCD